MSLFTKIQDHKIKRLRHLDDDARDEFIVRWFRWPPELWSLLNLTQKYYLVPWLPKDTAFESLFPGMTTEDLQNLIRNPNFNYIPYWSRLRLQDKIFIVSTRQDFMFNILSYRDIEDEINRSELLIEYLQERYPARDWVKYFQFLCREHKLKRILT